MPASVMSLSTSNIIFKRTLNFKCSFFMLGEIFNIDGWKVVALANLRYNVHLLALADQTRELALQRSPHDAVDQTRAQAVFMKEGRVPRQIGRPCPVAGSVHPCTLPR